MGLTYTRRRYNTKGINDSGQIILWGDLFNGNSRAALYDSGQVKDLGTLGGKESWAYGINNSGVVVGSAGLFSGIYHAFVYDGTGMADLGTLGGYYSIAFGVNDAGVIVGAAQDIDGQWEAACWVPVPEPGTLEALVTVMAAIAVFRKKPRCLLV